MLTQSRLKELLRYDPETGEFIRLVGRSGPRARKGAVAGRVDSDGYVKIYVDGLKYKGHRLAFLYTLGRWPHAEADHVNGARADNRWSNLRDASPEQNRVNRKLNANNTCGLKGVSFYKPTGKWKAQIQRDGRKIGLGYFATADEAAAAYVAASRSLHGEFARAA